MYVDFALKLVCLFFAAYLNKHILLIFSLTHFQILIIVTFKEK